MTTDQKVVQLLATRHPFHDLEAINADQLSDDEAGTIPRWWIDAQTASNPVDVALRAWENAIPGQLPRTTLIIRDAAPSLRLCRATLSESGRTAVVLAYIFGEANPSYFQVAYGLAPLQHNEIPLFTAGIDHGLRTFYTTVQNGFFNEDPIGLMPAQDMPRISNFGEAADFEYVGQSRDPVSNELRFVEIPESELPEIDQLVGVCRDASDNAVALDTRDDSGRVWEMWHGGLERIDKTLWEAIDEWVTRLFGIDDH
ncbi:hypothetical protein HYG77_30365 [Rhodococcus sp. ZPP]|uniref:hypothetical protein n=1 Tax=Rhodococcus sp. ZPP TaxID=2749906 RepID=UPI001AD85AE0|nr:hypothetical protein [Rhodococcus sp. ZPP]QTJ69414.1 hypothetical protein HYG77_30365 [Rhodococcus sp. ZPP]